MSFAYTHSYTRVQKLGRPKTSKQTGVLGVVIDSGLIKAYSISVPALRPTNAIKLGLLTSANTVCGKMLLSTVNKPLYTHRSGELIKS